MTATTKTRREDEAPSEIEREPRRGKTKRKKPEAGAGVRC